MTANKGLRLGTTIYSFSNEFHARKYSVEQLIDKVGELGLGPGVEMVGYSHIREFPVVTDEFAAMFQAAMQRNKLEPACLALNADVYRRRNQPMDEQESYDYHVPQIEAAARLGFPVARCQFLAGAQVIRRLAPLAEKLNVKLGMELHAPETVTSPKVMEFREMMAKENSPYLGFIPDFSSSACGVPKCFLDFFRNMGIEQKYIDVALEAWRAEGSLPERLKLYQETEKAAGANENVIRGMFPMFTMLGKMEPKRWAEIVPQAVHIHGKCYDFDEQGNEAGLPYEQILPVFVENGYNGFMSTEWEGHAFSDESGFEKVKAQHALSKRILAKCAPPASA